MSRERFLNRDLSLLAFQARVLAQAADPGLPLLERVRFLAIFSSNLDEFFMKRVAALRHLQAKGAPRAGHDGRSPAEVLGLARAEVGRLFAERARLWREELKPALGAAGIELLAWDALAPAEREFAAAYFREQVYPVLTPLAVDPAHPFPFLSNLSLSLGVRLRRPGAEEPLFARLKIPEALPQWVPLGRAGALGRRFCRLSDLVRAHLAAYFPEMEVEAAALFRVLRSAEVEQVIEDADDMLEAVEEELRLRRMAEIVAVQQAEGSEAWFASVLARELQLEADDFYTSPGELNWAALGELAALPEPGLRFEAWVPQRLPAPGGEEADIFRSLREQDLLLHFPYDSFEDSVVRLVGAAARDPQVLAIKIALYRLGEDSPLVPLLIEAAEAGKQVACVVEIKARFDEARNIYWSEQLERAGVHVVYGVLGLKTHAKIALVLRREEAGFGYYAHVGTGNYNSATARLYSDFNLFSADRELGQELTEIFNYLTGLSLKRDYRHFLLAPVNMREGFLELIEAEAALARQGKPGRIVAKMNALEDAQLIEALYAASRDGVRIQLIVRGFCCLRPGLPGLSENISVRSILGRFLEHSRAYVFFGGQPDPERARCYIGSADWMGRNLSGRVETIAPVRSARLRRELWDILDLALDEKAGAWELEADGSYRPPRPAAAGGFQSSLMRKARERTARA